MDAMFIEDLEVKCIIGTKPEERKKKQSVVISVLLDCDLAKAARTDGLKDAVNYHSLEKRLIGLVEASSYFLVEKLAVAIACECLAHDKRIKNVSVRVVKPAAGIRAKMIGVEISRCRGGGR